MKLLFSIRYLIVLCLFLITASPLFARSASLSLSEAVSIALQNNPELLAAQWEVQARNAGIRQAGAIPNPDLQILFEDLGGSGEFEGFAGSQTTAQLSQRLELGGKRGARRSAAFFHRDVAKADLEVRRRNLVASVRRAFFAILIAQERERSMNEILEVSRQFLMVVSERIQAGKIPPIDEVKAQTVVALAEIDLTRSTQELTSARYELAQWMGAPGLQFQSIQGELAPVDLQLETLIQSAGGIAEFKKAEVELQESKALLNVERSKRIPDLTVTGGYRQIELTGDSAFVAGLSLPLPLFDRNQGAIAQAQHRIQKSEQLRAAVSLQVKTGLTRSYHAYSAAKMEWEALKSRVVPASQSTFDAISEGYRLGKYGYLDVLEAQRTLFQSRLQLLRAITDLSNAAAEIERWTGTEVLQLNGGSQ